METKEREPLIRLADIPALEWLPKRNGKPVHLSTVHRWVTRGIDGRRLQTVRAGGSLATTESWIEEFFGEKAAPIEVARIPTMPQRQRAIARAERELAADGL